MRSNGWRGATRAKKVRTTVVDPTATRAPDLVDRQLSVPAPNRLLVADFTFVPLTTGTGTRSPTPRSWSTPTPEGSSAGSARHPSTLRSLNAPLGRPSHCDSETGNPCKTRESGRFITRMPGQYTSSDHAALAGDLEVTLSTGRTGQCWDNALAESFFASLKGECLDQQPWPTRAAARRATIDYIAWFNGTRLHSALGYQTPDEFETATNDEEVKQVA